ncbi:MAG: methyltransferase domain-containing protein [Alphaproteobacteria bacterium]|nr:methyltransferase domain-containing protein [Alphaproteobacteria bacterium]
MAQAQPVGVQALAVALWWWADFVYAPARALKPLGLYRGETVGSPPEPDPWPGAGPRFSRELDGPWLLDEEPGHYDSVAWFDEVSAEYDQLVMRFSGHIFAETVARMRPHLGAAARILDPSAGPGRQAMDLAALVPDGEVVAADLSREMVLRAHADAQARGIRNMAFVQADVSQPPAAFDEAFDAIFCCLAFHHYPDGRGAVEAFARVLAPGGVAFVADAGPAWMVALARDISVAGDPGFVRHRTGHEFVDLFRDAGFRHVSWEEILPGMGLTTAVK